MDEFGPALNGLTVGSWFNAMLYMLEIVQLTYYIKHSWKRGKDSKGDKLPIRCIVIICFIVDTLCTIAICSWVFLSDVIHWGDVQYLTQQYWPVPTKVMCTSTVALLVQSFLISRYYHMSKQRIISCVLGFFSITSFAGGISVSVVLVFYSSYADRYKGLATTPVWMAASAVADICIAVALVISLSKAGSKTSMPRTKKIISRLIIVAIQSGTFTSVLAILLLSTYLARPTTNDSAYFSFCLGRAYTLTMLFNLNLRTSIEKSRSASIANTLGGMGGSSGARNSGSVGFKPSLGGSANRMELGRAATKVDEVYDLGGIQVHRIADHAADEKRNSAPFNNSGYGEPKAFQTEITPDSSHAI